MVDDGRHSPRKAMILAAGRGQRLRPLTDSVPKCMARVAGRPILEHTVRRLRRYGIEEAVINICHLPDMVVDHFGDGERFGMRIFYSLEATPLGTAGGVKRAEWFLDEPFFVLYGDNLSTCALDRLARFHAHRRGIVALALFHRDDPTSSGIVDLDDQARVVRFLEKPAPHEAFSRWVNAGIYLCDPALLRFIPAQGQPDFGRDIFPAIVSRGVPVYGYRMTPDEGLWWIDTPQDLAQLQQAPPRHVVEGVEEAVQV